MYVEMKFAGTEENLIYFLLISKVWPVLACIF